MKLDIIKNSGKSFIVISFLIYIFLIPNFALSSDSSESLSAKYVPGEIIIKFKGDKTEKINLEIQGEKDLSEGNISVVDFINNLNKKYKAQKIEPVFKSLRKNGKVIKAEDESQNIRNRFKKRSQRAPKSAKIPQLENIYRITLNKDTDILKAVEEYSKDPNVEYAEPNYVTEDDLIPNDPYWNSDPYNWGHNFLYGLENIHCLEAWDITTGRNDVIIAPIESGIEITHEDLASNMWVNADEIPNNGIDDDNNGYIDDYKGAYFSSSGLYSSTIPNSSHGTHVSGTIAAVGNNSKGVIGVAWNSKIMPALGDSITGKSLAIIYAADNGADVLNNSWKSFSVSNTVKDAVDYAHSLGCVVVASAGNNNTETISQTPAQCENVITVAAVDYQDKKASFSNYGIKVDVTAPGVSVGSTYYNNSYGGLDGTSMAAPHVSGVAALIISRNLDLNAADSTNYPILTNEEIRQIIRKSADDLVDPLVNGGNHPGFDIYSGYGRINASRALQYTSACEANITYPIATLTKDNYDFTQGADFYFNGWTTVTGTIDIKGVAKGRNFSGYKVEYGKGYNPTNWTLIVNSTTPVDGTQGNDTLSSGFNTNLLDNGVYTIKLTTTDTNGEIYEDRLMINVARALITNLPIRDDELSKEAGLFFEPYDIEGIATGPGFVSYHLEYGIGTNPTEWIRASNDVTTPVNSNGILFDNFDFRSLPNGTLTIKLVINDTIIGISEDTLVIENDSLNFPNQTGFPVSSIATYGFSSPVTADINNDGKKEIIIGSDYGVSNYGYLDIFDSNGNKITTINISYNAFIQSSPVVGNLDDDSELEIGLKYIDRSSNQEKVVFYNHDGTVLASWGTRSFAITNFSYTEQLNSQSSLVLSDLDNDGKCEIIFGTSNNKVYIYKYNGTEFTGWEGGKSTSAGVIITPVVGDINKDNSNEIIARDRNNNIYVWDKDGSLLWSAVERGTFVYTDRIALADMNGDGYLEIISSNYYTYNPAGISIWDRNGNRILSKELSSGIEWAYTFGLGDLNNDNLPEIIIPGRDYDFNIESYVFPIECIDINGNSLPGWPVFADNDVYAGYPLIGDIDNDGGKEVLISFYGRTVRKIVGYRANGTKVNGDNWPIRKMGYYVSSMALDDLDNDGDIELIFRGSAKELRVWDLPYSYSPQNIDWPMFQKNPQHTGNYNSYYQDITSPITPVVTDEGDYTRNIDRLSASWSSYDLESEITEYQYQILQDSTFGIIIKDWTSTGKTNNVIAEGLNLNNGTSYYFAVKSKNTAGLWSNIGYSDGIIVDTTFNSPPTVVLNANPTSGNIPLFVTFTANALDIDGQIVSYDWDFDGNDIYDTATVTNTISFTYNSGGNYIPKVKVIDNEGGTGFNTTQITVNYSPVANAGQDQNAEVYIRLTFNGTGSYDPDGSISQYKWDFGNGVISYGSVVNYTYNSVGVYNVGLTVTDNNGATNTDYCIVTITPNITPPSDVSNFTVYNIGTSNQLELTWINPTESDFSGVKILRKEGVPPSGVDDTTAVQVYKSKGLFYLDTTVVSGINYFYSAFSYDTSNNYSSGVTQNNTPSTIDGRIVLSPVYAGYIQSMTGLYYKYDNPANYLYWGVVPSMNFIYYRSFIKWDISSIPLGDIIITGIELRYAGAYYDPNYLTLIGSLENDPQIPNNGANNQLIFNDISNGFVYSANNPSFPSLGINVIVLDTTAIDNLGGSINSWWGIGISEDSTFYNSPDIFYPINTTYPKLIINFRQKNKPPVLDPIGDKTVDEGQLLQFAVSASDPNGDSLTYSATGLPEGAAFDTTNTFLWIPNYTQAGTYAVTFTVSDGELTDSETINIAVNDVNRAPILSPIGNKTVDEGQLLQFSVTGSDPDGDLLGYTVSELPSGANFDTSTNTFTWTPDYTQAGSYNVTFTVSDGSLTDSETITITVNNVNRSPILDSIGNKTVDEGQLLQFGVSGFDPDGDLLGYTVSELPSGANFDTFTNTFTWTPDYTHAGSYNVTFMVSDGSLTDSELIIITVNNVNRTPVLDPIGNKTVDENQLLQFTITGNDPDGDVLTYTATGLPAGAVFDSNTRTFTWTPNYNQSGSYNVTFTVSDGSLTDSETITITVNNTLDIPNSPSNLTATRTSNKVKLTWQDNSSDESGFKIERNISGIWSQIATVGVNINSYTDTNGKKGYSYRVRAYNAAGDSAYSNTVTVK